MLPCNTKPESPYFINLACTAPLKARNHQDNWYTPMIMDQGESETCVRYALASCIYSQCYYIYLNKAIAKKDKKLEQEIWEARRGNDPLRNLSL